MKKVKIILIISFISCFLVHGQEKKPFPKIIKVSKNFSTVLIFPDEIIEDFLGNKLEFLKYKPKQIQGVFSKKIVELTYNRKAKNIPNMTNYTVITKDGNFYEFLLDKVNTLTRPSYFINKNIARKNIFELSDDDKTIKEDEIISQKYTYYTESLKDVIYYYDTNKIKSSKWYSLNSHQMDSLYNKNKIAYLKLKTYEISKKIKKGRYFEKSGNVYIWLKGIYYDKNEIYINFYLENKETLDFEVDFIKTKIFTIYKKKSTKQNLSHKPLMVYNQPKIVKGNQGNYFQIVFNRFTLSEKRALLIEIKEKNGERDLSIEIPNNFINNPIKN